jgi:uncharacterized protein YyaL (SSP411 family)
MGALRMNVVTVDNRPTAYVCRDFACLTPATDADTLRGQLETLGRHE